MTYLVGPLVTLPWTLYRTTECPTHSFKTVVCIIGSGAIRSKNTFALGLRGGTLRPPKGRAAESSQQLTPARETPGDAAIAAAVGVPQSP